jgi:hypothetical protein
MRTDLITPARRVGSNVTTESVTAAPAAPASKHIPETSSGAHIASLTAEMRELRAELEQLRAERNRLGDLQRRIMELLNVQSPERLLHDLRNVLNERQLLRMLTAGMETET